MNAGRKVLEQAPRSVQYTRSVCAQVAAMGPELQALLEKKKKKKKHPNLVLSHAITQPSVQETIIFYGCSLSVPLSKRAAG